MMATKPKSGRSPAGLLDFAAQAKSALFGGAKDTPAPRSMPDPRYKMLSQLTPAKLEQINKMVDDVTAAENVNILRDPAELAKVVAQFENLPQMQRSRELSEMDRELLLRRADRKASPDYLTPLKEFANMSYGTKFDIQPKEEPSILQDAAGYSAAQRRQAGGDIDSLAKIFQTGSMGKLTTTKGSEFGETYTAEDPEKKKDKFNEEHSKSLEKVWDVFKDSAEKDLGAIQSIQDSIPVFQTATEDLKRSQIGLLKRKIIVSSGDTRPSDKDVDAFGGDTRLLKAAQRFHAEVIKGETIPEDWQQLTPILEGLSKVVAKRMIERVEGHTRAAQYAHPNLRGENPKRLSNFFYERMAIDPRSLYTQASVGFRESVNPDLMRTPKAELNKKPKTGLPPEKQKRLEELRKKYKGQQR